MADEFHTALGINAKLIPGQSGIFDVMANGKLIYSKAETGRFPETGELVAKLKQ